MGEEVNLILNVAKHFPAKIHSTSSTAAIKLIKEKLTEVQLSLFRTTCFGKLLDMNDLKFYGQLVHHLLLRQIQSPNKSEMWFSLGGKTFRFSIQEFCLITGLECGPDLPVVSKENGDGSGSFRSSMLNGEVRLNNRTLEAMFKAASSDNDEDMVKLALLYFLETVLFGKDQKVHIGAQHVELLEDLETFNKYPWGRKCYETTLNSLQKDFKKMSQDYHTTSRKIVSGKKRKCLANNEKDCIRQYALHGFPYAFQIWACEAIPTVGVAIANKSGSLLPRIVNWITLGTPDATYVTKLMDRKNTQVLKKLQPTPRESGEEYVKFLLSPENVLEPHELNDEDEEDACEGAEENRPANAYAPHQHQSKVVCLDCKAKNEENTRKLDALGKRMDEMDKKLDFIINLLRGEGQTHAKDRDNSQEAMKDDMELDGSKSDDKVVLDTPEEHVHVVVSKIEEKCVHEHFQAQVNVEDKCNTTVDITTPMVDMQKKASGEGISTSVNSERSIIVYEKHPPSNPKRRPRKAAMLKSPYADTEALKPKKLMKFKPFPKLPQFELNKFMSWLQETDSKDDDSKNVVQLPLCRATRAWFKTLYTPDKWLNDEHIDSALYWIRKVKFESPTNKMEVCTTTDVLFQVYIPLNYESNHWILAEVDLIARKIIVFDSEVNFIGSGKKFNKFMEPLSTLLPLLLHKIDFFSKRPEIQHREDMTHWIVERCANVPQQEKCDCGVFVIKFAEHLIHGESIDLVKAEKAAYFRQQLCLNL
ncbi:hypothetical protein LWI29_027297 [Acer saccharum]|uniref:Ubiquitin-like protease family profile domain-containing protein n=1 Tax=Acer saccharum TaxID=4024 RepID=A0AA39W047_ACESA|nr:hypothetical protein LWI29_027297 [Acer saccharum]